ncbi:hypothetical protein D1N68_20875, partial [Clostridioides difficile]|uniref:hypothetical protein n=1 Tax=Clostridioides difficile TaxID=1496 RepID=UPI00155ACB53
VDILPSALPTAKSLVLFLYLNKKLSLLKNPSTSLLNCSDNKFAEEEYLRARKREKMAKESLKGRKAKEEQEYFKREIEKA